MSKLSAYLKLVLALPLAASLLAGCNVRVNVPTPPSKSTSPVRPAQSVGQVAVSFKGLAAYKALATSVDVARVAITLTPSHGRSQHQEIYADRLHQPLVTVAFEGVAVGPVNLDVQAYDDNGRVIGDGHGGTVVQAGSTAIAHLTVGLTPADGKGTVTALIDFIELPQPTWPACHTAEFRAADLDTDGFLSREEFGLLWQRDNISNDDGPQRLEAGKTPYELKCAMLPIANYRSFPPAMSAFDHLDLNGDGRLDDAEFCGYVAPPRPPMPSFYPLPLPSIEPMPLPLYSASPVPTATPTTPAPEPTTTPSVIGARPLDFDAMDTDGDGHVSWEEYFSYRANGQAVSADQKTRFYDAFRQIDTNHNHTLERAEMLASDPGEG